MTRFIKTQQFVPWSHQICYLIHDIKLKITTSEKPTRCFLKYLCSIYVLVKEVLNYFLTRRRSAIRALNQTVPKQTTNELAECKKVIRTVIDLRALSHYPLRNVKFLLKQCAENK